MDNKFKHDILNGAIWVNDEYVGTIRSHEIWVRLPDGDHERIEQHEYTSTYSEWYGGDAVTITTDTLDTMVALLQHVYAY